MVHTIPLNIELGERRLGPRPANTQCPQCGQYILTKTEPGLGMFACLSSSLFCLLGCWLCALLPCYCNCFLDVSHYCPQCYQFVGIFRRI